MRFSSLLIVAAVILLLASCVTPVVTPTATATIAPTPTSGVDPCLITAKTYRPGTLPPGRIAFNCYSDPNAINIYTFDTTTGTIANLTHDNSTNGSIQWSPDGQQIAFYSNRNAHPGIYLMNANGSQLKWLVDGGIPRWSPDGKRIAFMRDDGLYAIYADSGQQVHLANNLYYYMAWSPDAKRLVFVVKQDGIRAIDADGAHEVKLTSYPADSGSLVWSSDGSHIYFLSPYAGSRELYSVDVSGGQPIQLTSTPKYIDFFFVSPNGKYIALIGDAAYVMNSNGTQIRRVLDTQVNHLSWSPDSQYLVFAYDQLAAVKVDNGQVVTLTNISAFKDYPEWSPK